MKKSITLAVIFVAFCITSCSNSLKGHKYKENDLRFSLSKGVCFGKCPVYDLKIYHNGKAVFVGEQHTEKIGQYEKMLTKEDYKNLEKAFVALDFDKYPDQFERKIPDLPTIGIGYNNGAKFRVITGSEDRPEDLMQVQFLLERIVDNKEWNFVKSIEEIKKGRTPEPAFIYNEIIIEPKKGLLLSKWLESNDKYSVRLIKKIAPGLNYYLIEFDPKKIDPKTFIEILYKDKDIKSAEFNKKTTLRNGK